MNQIHCMAGRLPGHWDEPDAFNPDRFSVDKPVPTETTEDFNYLPFGGGRRKCIGAARPRGPRQW